MEYNGDKPLVEELVGNRQNLVFFFVWFIFVRIIFFVIEACGNKRNMKLMDDERKESEKESGEKRGRESASEESESEGKKKQKVPSKIVETDRVNLPVEPGNEAAKEEESKVSKSGNKLPSKVIDVVCVDLPVEPGNEEAKAQSDAELEHSESEKKISAKRVVPGSRRTRTAKNVESYREGNSSGSDEEVNACVEVYEPFAAGVLAGETYECIEDKGNCVIIKCALNVLEANPVFKGLFGFGELTKCCSMKVMKCVFNVALMY
jgi:hypothetical protein